MTDKIISLNEMRKKFKLERERREATNLRHDIKAELDYRTEKFLEFMDEHQKRIERLEANLRACVRILKNLSKKD